MTKVTVQNNGSPQISRVLRDREEQAGLEGGQLSETGAYALDRAIRQSKNWLVSTRNPRGLQHPPIFRYRSSKFRAKHSLEER